ncbi:MAG: hypothetical protein FWF45_03650 [Coriobacteriia bacterium]|nr:hypothetical protein [Coriobacteriia bacterium]
MKCFPKILVYILSTLIIFSMLPLSNAGAAATDPAPSPATNVGNGWTAYEETSSFIYFIGAWGKATNPANSGGALNYSKQAGAAAQIRFAGDGIEWDGIRASTCGKARVTLDGVGQGTINLTTNKTYYKQALFHKTGLNAAVVHTLTITVVSATPTAACVDRIMVHNGSARIFAPATETGNGWNGYYELHSSIVYSGSWNKVSSSRSYDGAVKLSSTKGASFQVSFKGNSIEWVGITASTYGFVSVVLDGITQKSLSLTTPQPQYKQALFHREGLDAAKTHTLKVTITSSAKPVTIDRIMIHGTAFCNNAQTVNAMKNLGSARQLILVTAPSLSSRSATINTYQKTSSGWHLVSSMPGILGKNGLGKTKEGDSRSPAGKYLVGMAFGEYGNPGTKLSYHLFKSGDVWVENPAYPSVYNTLQNVSTSSPLWKDPANEKMYYIRPYYNYGFVIKYNTARTPGAGSGIFFHCSGSASYTAGCTAASQAHVVSVLKWLDPSYNPVIIQDSIAHLTNY